MRTVLLNILVAPIGLAILVVGVPLALLLRITGKPNPLVREKGL